MNSPTRRVAFFVVSAGLASATTAPLVAQDSLALAGVHWREIGPYRGGRSVAATGNASRPNEFWMGTTGGGVFKSINAGQSWAPVTDNYFGGTIGAIAVSASSPDVVYVGGGEYPIRGNVSHGDGVWKTTDGGKTWTFKGLAETRQIADIVVNPTTPDLVYVGALGHVWAPNPERGVFRSKDGGKTWEKILFRNDSTGVVDLVMDPHDPNVLYAGLWQAGRTPWLLSSGGKGSGMFKTTDGGDHWTEITRNPGLPEGIWGNIGITVSGGNSNRVWANIEADSGGVFRSDDGGATWQRTNNDRNLRQRAWYYTKIHADSMRNVRGIRRLIETERNPAFCLEPQFLSALRLLPKHDLTFDICVKHTAMAYAIELVKRCPEVSFVLDHIGKPDIKNGLREPWWGQIKELARFPNVVCKISGVVTEADHQSWKAEQVKPYVAHVIESFGFNRVMYGSDWTVSELTHPYPVWVDILDDVVKGSSQDELRKLYRETAIRTYRLPA